MTVLFFIVPGLTPRTTQIALPAVMDNDSTVFHCPYTRMEFVGRKRCGPEDVGVERNRGELNLAITVYLLDGLHC